MVKPNSGIELSTGEEIAKFIKDHKIPQEELRSFKGVDKDTGNARFEKLCHFNSKANVPTLSEAQKQAKAESLGIEWKEGYAERTIPYFASDERADSYGDIVLQNWIFDAFAKNPVMPYSHRWYDPPVANAIDWKVVDRDESDYKGKALYLLSLYPDAEVNEKADQVFRLVKSGFLKAGSVGFWSGKAIWIEDDEERLKLGLGKWGYLLDDNHLLEFSPTTIPANDGALTLANAAKTNGLLKAEDIDVVRDLHRHRILTTTKSMKDWEEVDERLCRIKKSVFNVDSTKHKDLEKPFFETERKDSESDRLARLESSYKSLESKYKDLLSKHSQLESVVEDFVLNNVEVNSQQPEIEISEDFLKGVSSFFGLEN